MEGDPGSKLETLLIVTILGYSRDQGVGPGKTRAKPS